MGEKKVVKKVLIISNPFPTTSKVGQVLLGKLINIMKPHCEELTLLAGNQPKNWDYKYAIKSITFPYVQKSKYILLRGLKYLSMQLKVSKLLFQTRNQHYNVAFFFVAGLQIFPLILARILGITSVMFAVASPAKSYRAKFGKKGILIEWFANLLEWVCHVMANYIAVESMSVIEHMNINAKKDKIVELSLYVDINKFSKKKLINDRRFDIGYIGRFAYEKRVLELLQAIKGLKGDGYKFKVLIGGSGPLLLNVVDTIEEINSNKYIFFQGWISPKKMPDILNNIKILVLPSDTEGLPNIVIEAMACGTIALATKVGGIPDVVIPQKTGFLLEGNSPHEIANGLVYVLNHESLERISTDSSRYIREKLNYKSVSRKMKTFLLNTSCKH